MVNRSHFVTRAAGIDVEVLGHEVCFGIDPHDEEQPAVVCWVSPNEARSVAAALTTMADQIDPPAAITGRPFGSDTECQYPDCSAQTIGGTPTPDGYRFVCTAHWHANAEHRVKLLDIALAEQRAAQTKQDAA